MSHESGPFGRYERESGGHVLNHLCKWGIPLHVVENLRLGNLSVHSNNGELFAAYKYFEGIDQPLFRFRDKTYANLQSQNGFQLSLGPHENPSLYLYGLHKEESVLIHRVVRRCLTNVTSEKAYYLTKDAGAFFQGGSNDPEGGFIYVEFWRPEGAEQWLHHFNENLRQARAGTLFL